MKEEKNKKDNGNMLTAFEKLMDYLGVKPLGKVAEIVVEYAKKEPQKFYSIASVLSAIAYWFVKSIKYYYIKGVFSVYGIDDVYIKVNDSIIFDLIKVILIVSVVILSNTIFIYVSSRKKPLKGILNCLIFCIIESLILFVIVWFYVYVDTVKIFSDPIWSSLSKIALLEATLIISVVIVNIYAISTIIYFHKKNKQKNKKEEHDEIRGTGIITKDLLIRIFISTTIFLMLVPITYKCGQKDENARRTYKICELKHENYNISWNLNSLSSEANKDFFAVVYEDNDSYFICPIGKDGEGKTVLDASIIQIVDREGILTYSKQMVDYKKIAGE